MNETKSISKAFSDRFKEVDKLFSQSFGSFIHWFLADVAYTLLPIGVIASIKALTFDQGDYLYLSPEWSFATIVSFGAAITNLIEIKTEIQQDFSYRIYMGTRFYILLLTMSVIVLCLVVLRDDGLNINSRILWAIQL